MAQRISTALGPCARELLALEPVSGVTSVSVHNRSQPCKLSNTSYSHLRQHIELMRMIIRCSCIPFMSRVKEWSRGVRGPVQA